MIFAVATLILSSILLPSAYAYDPQSLVAITLTDQHYSSPRYVPLEGDYVYLDVSVQNLCCSTLHNELFWVHFISEATHKEDSFFVWHLQNLTIGQTQILHLGPFKLRENWNHDMFIGINQAGSQAQANDMNVVFGNNQVQNNIPILTITAYPPNLFTQIIPLALGIGIGLPLLIKYWLKKKLKKQANA